MRDLAFVALEKYIHDLSMLSFRGHKRAVLKAKLEARAALLGLQDLNAYLDLVQEAGSERTALMDLVTTNETFFFRNRQQFDFMMKKIVPEMETERGKAVIRSWGDAGLSVPASIMKIRILCAGCSTGEEPYSIAMSLLESLRYPKAWDIKIIAGDISASCLARARAGIYDEERMKGLPPHLREKYFSPVEEGFAVTEEVKALVDFYPLNLAEVIDGASLPAVEQFDMIFCRNVMIYFAVDTQQRLVDALFDLLVPGGYFFTGDAEALHIYDHGFQTVHDAECLVYAKVEKTEHARAISTHECSQV